MELTFTKSPGRAFLINGEYLPQEHYITSAAIVDDEYDRRWKDMIKQGNLLQSLIAEGHWGVLDHACPTFKIECPIFVARQLMRSSNSSFNEISGRYREVKPKFYIPREYWKDVRRQDLGLEPIAIEWQEALEVSYKRSVGDSWEVYESMVSQGVRKEQARLALPLSTFTEFWWTAPLSDWLHMLNLRLDSHAQWETQNIAAQILGELNRYYPNVIELWERYARGPINEAGTIQTP